MGKLYHVEHVASVSCVPMSIPKLKMLRLFLGFGLLVIKLSSLGVSRLYSISRKWVLFSRFV